MTTWTDDKEQELFEAQETIADLLMLYSAEQNECAGLHATNAELLEALGSIATIIKGSKSQMENQIGYARRTATEAIRKAGR